MPVGISHNLNLEMKAQDVKSCTALSEQQCKFITVSMLLYMGHNWPELVGEQMQNCPRLECGFMSDNFIKCH